jgi:hypothetical protein
MLFCQDNRDELRAAHPELKPHDIARRFGDMWKALPEGVREVRRCERRCCPRTARRHRASWNRAARRHRAWCGAAVCQGYQQRHRELKVIFDRQYQEFKDLQQREQEAEDAEAMAGDGDGVGLDDEGGGVADGDGEDDGAVRTLAAVVYPCVRVCVVCCVV